MKTDLHTLVPLNHHQDLIREVRELVAQTGSDGWMGLVEDAFWDTVRLFRGEFPGFRKSNTRYHDLEHTLGVFLAAARLAHGAHLCGRTLSDMDVMLLLSSALFHDAGLIQTEDDQEGTGAKYTVGHELRSIAFMQTYLEDKGVPAEHIRRAGQAIACTVVDQPIEEIPFSDAAIRFVGQLLGTADLLAQMADRAYLEKLFLLYREFQEAGIRGFDSELSLLEKTEDFYESVVKKRLGQDYDNVASYMRHHFQERFDLDRDFYAESVHKNIEYLRLVLEETRSLHKKRLRRNVNGVNPFQEG